jgi:hypothetical protein
VQSSMPCRTGSAVERSNILRLKIRYYVLCTISISISIRY